MRATAVRDNRLKVHLIDRVIIHFCFVLCGKHPSQVHQDPLKREVRQNVDSCRPAWATQEECVL